MPAFGRIAELRIREAMEEGKFDRLPNSGQPIDLEWYFAMAPHLRLGFSLLRSNDCAPQEVELLKEIEEMERTLAAKTDQHERQALARRIRDQRLRVNLMIERQRREP